jgi:hypothetical protein
MVVGNDKPVAVDNKSGTQAALLEIPLLAVAMNGPKNSSKGFRLPPKGFPKKCLKTGLPPLMVLTVRMLTTPGLAASASSLKLSGA